MLSRGNARASSSRLQLCAYRLLLCSNLSALCLFSTRTPVAGDGRSPRTCSTAAAADIGPRRRHRVEIGWRWAEDQETYKIDTRMTMLQRTMRGEVEEGTVVLFFLATFQRHLRHYKPTNIGSVYGLFGLEPKPPMPKNWR